MNCDLCNAPAHEFQVTIVGADDMISAAQGGFRPYSLRQIPKTKMLAPVKAEPDVDVVWAQDVINGKIHHSKWNICHFCMLELNTYLRNSQQVTQNKITGDSVDYADLETLDRAAIENLLLHESEKVRKIAAQKIKDLGIDPRTPELRIAYLIESGQYERLGCEGPLAVGALLKMRTGDKGIYTSAMPALLAFVKSGDPETMKALVSTFGSGSGSPSLMRSLNEIMVKHGEGDILNELVKQLPCLEEQHAVVRTQEKIVTWLQLQPELASEEALKLLSSLWVLKCYRWEVMRHIDTVRCDDSYSYGYEVNVEVDNTRLAVLAREVLRTRGIIVQEPSEKIENEKIGRADLLRRAIAAFDKGDYSGAADVLKKSDNVGDRMIADTWWVLQTEKSTNIIQRQRSKLEKQLEEAEKSKK